LAGRRLGFPPFGLLLLYHIVTNMNGRDRF
jgi:hypothetical protein